ncbi:MAG: hypothetical protein LUI02_00020 [Clostridiales bacterium]|nr:hypothetical protein [Clostridiales bacterium]
MAKDSFDYQIVKLTQAFYDAYPNPPYTELLTKAGRAYNCLLIQSHYGYFICIPYRSEIKHEYSFRFKGTRRSKKHRSGLDYTKIAIISNTDFIDAEDAIIDHDERLKTVQSIDKIKAGAMKYVDDYVAQLKGDIIFEPDEFKRRYSRSTLQYFHRELGII